MKYFELLSYSRQSLVTVSHFSKIGLKVESLNVVIAHYQFIDKVIVHIVSQNDEEIITVFVCSSGLLLRDSTVLLAAKLPACQNYYLGILQLNTLVNCSIAPE